MPVVVYKTLNLNVRWVQGRRIGCEYCRQPFTYVWSDAQTFQVTGIPVVSSDDGMRKNAMKKAAKALGKIATASNKGEALCPHCKRYQGWMVRKSRFASVGCGFAAGLLLAAAVSMVAGIWYSWSWSTIYGVVGVGIVLGIVLGAKAALTGGPHRDKKDDSAMKDADVAGLLEASQQKDADPFLLWWVGLGNKPKEKEALIPLGVYDTSGKRPVFPRELSSTAMVRALQQG